MAGGETAKAMDQSNLVSASPVTAFKLDAFLPYRVVSLGQKMGSSILSRYRTDFSLGMAEWRVLAMIGQFDTITAARVVNETPMDKVAVSRAVARLVEREFVERMARSDDRRSFDLKLTERGQSVFDEIARRALAFEEQVLANLTDDERVVLDGLMNKLNDAVDELGD